MLIFAAREFFLSQNPKSIPKALTVPLGLFSGAISGAFNLGGIPTAAYAYANPWTRGQIMAFTNDYYSQFSVANCFLQEIWNAAGVFPLERIAAARPVVSGDLAGHLVMTKVPPQRMRKVVFAFIGVAGIYYLVR